MRQFTSLALATKAMAISLEATMGASEGDLTCSEDDQFTQLNNLLLSIQSTVEEIHTEQGKVKADVESLRHYLAGTSSKSTDILLHQFREKRDAWDAINPYGSFGVTKLLEALVEERFNADGDGIYSYEELVDFGTFFSSLTSD